MIIQWNDKEIQGTRYDRQSALRAIGGGLPVV